MARNDPQMNLRVPIELKEKIEKAAFENGRTITAEAVYRLEESFEQSKQSDLAELKQQIERMDQTIKTLSITLQSVANRGK